MVSKSRFAVPGQTYAVNGITSVAAHEERPKRWPAVLLMVVGAMAALGGLSPFNAALLFGGLIFAGAGFLWFKMLKPTYHVVLRSASGETRALSTKDGPFISRVLEAINRALIARG